MRYIWQHIQTITGSYKGDVPLTHYLKAHFRQHPKLGSRDRRIISEMCYCWYRCAKGILTDLQQEEKMGLCLFLCGSSSKYMLPYIPEHLRGSVTLPVSGRISLLQGNFNISLLLPYPIALSDKITMTEWLISILTQPRLYIRVRKDLDNIIKILGQHDLHYEMIENNCIALQNGAQADKILPADSYVVQDLSSQLTGNYFRPKEHEQWYDCCSGAGGKSLLLKDIEPTVKLTVTDRRESILHNLKERFKLYHHTLPDAHATEVDNAVLLKRTLGNKQFDGIICDVPCTGSGTWARTPEQLYFFDDKKLPEIALLQTAIATNAAAYLKPGGRFVYITCSIFRQENEDVVKQLMERSELELEEMHTLSGITDQADSMFVAVLKRC